MRKMIINLKLYKQMLHKLNPSILSINKDLVCNTGWMRNLRPGLLSSCCHLYCKIGAPGKYLQTHDSKRRFCSSERALSPLFTLSGFCSPTVKFWSKKCVATQSSSFTTKTKKWQTFEVKVTCFWAGLFGRIKIMHRLKPICMNSSLKVNRRYINLPLTGT